MVGNYVYLREAGSRPFVFLAGWISFWATDPPSISIMALAAVNYLGYLTGITGIWSKFVAVGLVLIFMAVHPAIGHRWRPPADHHHGGQDHPVRHPDPVSACST